jgi:hypothetical protein
MAAGHSLGAIQPEYLMPLIHEGSGNDTCLKVMHWPSLVGEKNKILHDFKLLNQRLGGVFIPLHFHGSTYVFRLLFPRL